jgi:hypothetical protein
MIEQFIVKSLLQGGIAKDPGTLTLADLADAEMKAIFERGFVVVKQHSMLADAKTAMSALEGCSDVFVTSRGTSQESVQGLLTNVEIARSS